MAQGNPGTGLLTRLRTTVASGQAHSIVNALEGLLEHPHDENLLSATGEMLRKDSKAFIGTVLDHFAVPAAGFEVARSVSADFPCGTAKTWKNYVGTQVAEPFEIACPKSLAGLQGVVAKAAGLGCPVRAVGSHHAWSDAAISDGIIIETSGLLQPLADVDATLLKDPSDAGNLKQVAAGMTIKDLNAALDQRGLALFNMGGFDGQTLGGVISTSTHGSGLSLGSFPSFVEALVVVRGDGQVFQIEKTAGITDPAKFAARGGTVQLIQDDKFFNASVVGIGCLGIIYSAILRIRSQYWLSETRTIHKWRELRDTLREGSVLRTFRHVEVLINPHVIDGDNTCLLTLRKEVPKPDQPSPPKPLRDLFAELLASLPGAGDALAALLRTFPALSPSLVEDAIKGLEDEDEFVAKSFEMLNIGAANGFPAVCSELGVDLHKHVDATNEMLALAAQARAEGAYQSGTIALRYVAASPGFLSMQPRETCMIELPMLRDVFGSDSLAWRYENLLTERFNARPHWGQRNFVTGSNQMLERLYGASAVRDWRGVFQWFNPKGEFYSRFTDRVGFSSHAPE